MKRNKSGEGKVERTRREKWEEGKEKQVIDRENKNDISVMI